MGCPTELYLVSFDATQKQPRGGCIVVTYGLDAADVAFATQFGTAKLTDFRVGEQVRGFYIDAFEEATQRVSGFLEGFSG